MPSIHTALKGTDSTD